MNGKFNEQKDILISIKKEISLLHQQVDYLIRNEKPLGLLDLDMMMNRTHTIYDLMCGVEVGSEEEVLPNETDTIRAMFGIEDNNEETNEEPIEEEPIVEEPIVEEPIEEEPIEEEPIEEEPIVEEPIVEEPIEEEPIEEEPIEEEPIEEEPIVEEPIEEEPIVEEPIEEEPIVEEPIEEEPIVEEPIEEEPIEEEPIVEEPIEEEPIVEEPIEEKPIEEEPIEEEPIVEEPIVEEPIVEEPVVEEPVVEEPVVEDTPIEKKDDFGFILNFEPAEETTPSVFTSGDEIEMNIPQVETQNEKTEPNAKEEEIPYEPVIFGNMTEKEDAGFELDTPETLGDKLQQEEDHSLAAKLQHSTVKDLRKAIGINEKFLFVNELFGGSMEKYNKSIENLNDLKTLNGALIYMNELRIELQWNSNNEAYKKLLELVHRKYEA